MANLIQSDLGIGMLQINENNPILTDLARKEPFNGEMLLHQRKVIERLRGQLPIPAETWIIEEGPFVTRIKVLNKNAVSAQPGTTEGGDTPADFAEPTPDQMTTIRTNWKALDFSGDQSESMVPHTKTYIKLPAVRNDALNEVLEITLAMVEFQEIDENPEPQEDKEQMDYLFEAYSNQRVYTLAKDHPPEPTVAGYVEVSFPVVISEWEQDLFRIFMVAGIVYEFRVAIDDVTNEPTGHIYITYLDQESAKDCVSALNNLEFKPNLILNVQMVEPRTKLFVGNIPKVKTEENLRQSFTVLTSALKEVTAFPNNKNYPESGNRGFCFLEYNTHGAAVAAMHRLTSMKVFGTDLFVEWARKEHEKNKPPKRGPIRVPITKEGPKELLARLRSTLSRQ